MIRRQIARPIPETRDPIPGSVNCARSGPMSLNRKTHVCLPDKKWGWRCREGAPGISGEVRHSNVR